MITSDEQIAPLKLTQIQISGDAAALEEFLQEYPEGPVADRARASLELIEYKQARKADTPEAYAAYLKRNPEGAHADEVKKRMSR